LNLITIEIKKKNLCAKNSFGEDRWDPFRRNSMLSDDEEGIYFGLIFGFCCSGFILNIISFGDSIIFKLILGFVFCHFHIYSFLHYIIVVSLRGVV
jgi:hypothetical protein